MQHFMMTNQSRQKSQPGGDSDYEEEGARRLGDILLISSSTVYFAVEEEGDINGLEQLGVENEVLEIWKR